MSLPELFQDIHLFRQQFLSGLDKQLRTDSLGAFILVLANAKFDPLIEAELHPRLQQRFGHLHRQLRSDLLQGCAERHAADDLMVFLKLIAVGLTQLETTRLRNAGPWQLQYNPLRAFRPPRMSQAVIGELRAAFDENRFHFNKPFLQQEIFWQGRLLDRQSRLFYNKFPFAPLHGLLVPDPEDRLCQWLRPEDHHWAWALAQQIGDALPGCGLGYNARGAFSSVNHLHFQMFAGKHPAYPVEDPRWWHNAGEEQYPIPCYRFDHAQTAWDCIHQLHQQNRSYNLLYRPGHIYILPRAMQGSYTHSPWTGGFAWAELAGAITLFTPEHFQQLSAQTIAAEMRKLA